MKISELKVKDALSFVEYNVENVLDEERGFYWTVTTNHSGDVMFIIVNDPEADESRSWRLVLDIDGEFE